jgi:hypothetical protein
LYTNPELVLLQWRKDDHHCYMLKLEIEDQKEFAIGLHPNQGDDQWPSYN